MRAIESRVFCCAFSLLILSVCLYARALWLSGATSELVAADCSHVDEVDMEKILLEEVDVSILENLELGQCGRSWTDKVGGLGRALWLRLIVVHRERERECTRAQRTRAGVPSCCRVRYNNIFIHANMYTTSSPCMCALLQRKQARSRSRSRAAFPRAAAAAAAKVQQRRVRQTGRLPLAWSAWSF